MVAGQPARPAQGRLTHPAQILQLRGFSASHQRINAGLPFHHVAMMRHAVPILLLSLLLTGCGVLSPAKDSTPLSRLPQSAFAVPERGNGIGSEKGNNIVLYALGLIDSGYRYGGKNPSAGLDCSGMVSHIYLKAAGIRVTGSAGDIARKGRPVEVSHAKPGDLVFFNTLNRPHSHVGIYIGEGRFVHAPNSQGKVRTESLTQGWFAKRLEEARTYFD